MSKPILALFPAAYAAGKLYSVLPENGSGDFTVSRNGTGTYLGQDGLIKTALANEPRFEYNSDGTFKGVLVEPAATNFIAINTNFTNPLWVKEGLSSPINFNTIFFKAGDSGVNRIRQSGFVGQRLNRTFTYSIDIPDSSKWSDLTATIGFKSSTSSNTVVISPLPFAQRYFFTETNETSGPDVLIILFSTKDLTIQGISFAQIEESAISTSRISTFGSQVTRPADVMTVLVPTNATQVSYILNGNVVTQSVVGGSIFTLPNGHITQLTMN